ncbi:ABC transporter ATP-binding protein [uncultured Propionibacterium sp.]|uniref:ABC transporter ATP-binding protein n=1 Tax=uncultured Propionibacterium sp. TaxID=218066 RepID=UPI00292CC0F0|nr:ABC transporter ATP-binding protein [uncultured Propionibacterium sp.]
MAQDTPILLLDEPTNHLDLEGTYDLMSIIRELGKTTICVLHDLNLALEYCDRVYILQNGRIVHEGTPREALEADNIRNVFGVDSEVTSGPDGQGNRLVFARRKD